MKFFRNLINLFSSRRGEQSSADHESLRREFQKRYQLFKQLIRANNRTLEATSDIERALMGDIPFDMSFVQSKCADVGKHVHLMVENLRNLAPGKYDDLTNAYNRISRKVEHILSPVRVVTDERLVISLNELDHQMSHLVGNKMANLGELKTRVKLIVPAGFAITSHAQDLFFRDNRLAERIRSRLQHFEKREIIDQYRECAAIQQMIIDADLPEALSDTILTAWQQMEAEIGQSTMVAVRSSALGEDALGNAFAGQYRSSLNIGVDSILNTYKEIVASKYSQQAMSYRWKKGIKDEDVLMGVGCVAMIDGIAGGVIYSKNPIDSQDNTVSINAAWGLPKAVVDGSIDCDLFTIARKKPLQITTKNIQFKSRKFVCEKEEGVCQIDLVHEKQDDPSLTDNQAVQLAEIALGIEAHYGYPQDIEWAIDDQGTIYILQCRPLQQKEVYEKADLDSQPEHGSTPMAIGRITVSPGAVSGTLFFVKTVPDMHRFPENAILVVSEALPKWAPLLNRAVGLISQHGSFAGHLANVAREFDIPAVFGFSNIDQILKDGDLITLDAATRAIHRGRIDALLTQRKSKMHPMEGTPVYNTLKAVSRYIVPLNLYDPESPDFKPSNCQSFHDITRFVHERAVKHMFRHERESWPPELATKQLYDKAPMKWWIINLDDGFKIDEEGKYVQLDNITSVPMLAFWEGFTAIPWEGPPTLDGKGFMSVMSRSHPGTALTSRLKSRFADQNYFMISKHFCHLSSRLGYHFSTLEALLTDTKEESYVKFHFRGGAAGYERRVKRISFIGDLLRAYGFWVEVKEDSLFARIEGYETDILKKRVKILGYLSIHTRQIDMIMKNRRAIQYHRGKLVRDIEWLMNKTDDF